MFNRLVIPLVTILLVSAPARASGDPLIGTVTALTGDTVTIKDKRDKATAIRLDKRTKYLKDDKLATKADLTIGVSVGIDANFDAKLKMYSAAEIKIGTSGNTQSKK